MFRHLLAFAALAALASPALAQQRAETVTVQLTGQEVQIIATGLNELPAKIANPVLTDLERQLRDVAEARAKSETEGVKKAPPAPKH